MRLSAMMLTDVFLVLGVTGETIYFIFISDDALIVNDLKYKFLWAHFAVFVYYNGYRHTRQNGRMIDNVQHDICTYMVHIVFIVFATLNLYKDDTESCKDFENIILLKKLLSFDHIIRFNFCFYRFEIHNNLSNDFISIIDI